MKAPIKQCLINTSTVATGAQEDISSYIQLINKNQLQ